jgi:hypothetical protein
MSNQTPLLALAGQIKFKLDRKVAERLGQLDKTHQLAMQRIGDLSANDLRNVWESLQKKALDALKRAETIDDVSEINEPSKAAIRAAAADGRASLKHSLRELSKEAVEIAMPEVRRFVLAALNHVKGLEDNERELCASFGITFMPSPLIVALKDEVARVQSGTERPWLGQIIRPASLIETFATL